MQTKQQSDELVDGIDTTEYMDEQDISYSVAMIDLQVQVDAWEDYNTFGISQGYKIREAQRTR